MSCNFRKLWPMCFDSVLHANRKKWTNAENLWQIFFFVSSVSWSLSQSCHGTWRQSIQGQKVFHVDSPKRITHRGSKLHSKLSLLSFERMETLSFGNNWDFFPKSRQYFSLQPWMRTVVLNRKTHLKKCTETTEWISLCYKNLKTLWYKDMFQYSIMENLL